VTAGVTKGADAPISSRGTAAETRNATVRRSTAWEQQKQSSWSVPRSPASVGCAVSLADPFVWEGFAIAIASEAQRLGAQRSMAVHPRRITATIRTTVCGRRCIRV